MLSLILLVFAFVLAMIAAFAYPTTTERGFFGRVNLIALALAFYFLSLILMNPMFHLR